ncbi:MAG: hypothetical protein ACYCS4_07750 [Acidimicrobiales bacterium]
MVAITDSTLCYLEDLLDISRSLGVEPVLAWKVACAQGTLFAYARSWSATQGLVRAHNAHHLESASDAQVLDCLAAGVYAIYEPPGTEVSEATSELLDATFGDRWYATGVVDCANDVGLVEWTHSGGGIIAGEIVDRLASEPLELVPPRTAEREYNNRLHKAVDEAAKRRGAGEATLKRLEREMQRIEATGSAKLVLDAAGLVDAARQTSIAIGPGRGSSCASAVCYVLGITDVDPEHYGLLFNRFLPPERSKAADIDIDVSSENRDLLLERFADSVAHERVWRVAMPERWTVRSALGADKATSDTISKARDSLDKDALIVALEAGESPETAAIRITGQVEDGRHVGLARALRQAQDLAGSVRMWKLHPSAVAIADTAIVLPAIPYTNTSSTAKSMVVADPATFGATKLDVCGSVVIDRLHRVETLLADASGTKLLPDDPVVYERLGRGELDHVFQLDSASARAIVQAVRPESFEELVACEALVRPGARGAAGRYAALKHGRAHVVYSCPELEAVLKPTFGLVVYQEQMLQIAHGFAGLDATSAERFRVALAGQATPSRQEALDQFVDAAIAQGRRPSLAEQVARQLDAQSGYSFSKAHAVAYARISYATAFYAARHPELWYRACAESGDAHDRSIAQSALLNELAAQDKKKDSAQEAPPCEVAQYGCPPPVQPSPFREFV